MRGVVCKEDTLNFVFTLLCLVVLQVQREIPVSPEEKEIQKIVLKISADWQTSCSQGPTMPQFFCNTT